VHFLCCGQRLPDIKKPDKIVSEDKGMDFKNFVQNHSPLLFSGGLIAAVVSAFLTNIGTLITRYLEYRATKEKDQHDLYFRYESRYSTLMATIAEHIPDMQTGKFDQSNGQLRRAMVDLFNLLSAEYFLFKKGLISEADWENWERNIVKKMMRPLFREAWAYVKGQMGFQGEFSKKIDAYIENIELRERLKMQSRLFVFVKKRMDLIKSSITARVECFFHLAKANIWIGLELKMAKNKDHKIVALNVGCRIHAEKVAHKIGVRCQKAREWESSLEVV